MKHYGINGSRRVAENILSTNTSELADGCRRYLQWMAVKNYSSSTITGAYYILNAFVYWVLRLGFICYTQIDYRVIEAYAAHLLEATVRPVRPIGRHYRYQSLHVIKNMFDYLADNAIIAQSPIRGLLAQPEPRRRKYMITHEQIEAILGQPDTDKWVGLRDRAILEMLYSTGIRRREFLGLRLDDVDLHAGVLYVRQGKGYKQRMVPIGERAIVWLSRYLYEVRPMLLRHKQCDMLFLTYKGTGFTISGLSNAIMPYLRAAGQKGGCHVFRHAMATVMLENGADISSIRDILGHEQLSSTQVYTHIATAKLQDIYEQTHPNAADTSTPEQPEQSIKPLYKWGGQPFTRKNGRKSISSNHSALGIWIGDYLCAMVEQNRSPLTIRKHREHLNEFAAWCDQRAIYEPTQLTHPLVERYHKELHRRRYRDKPLNPAYIGRHLIAIRRFCAWLYDTGVTSQDVAAKVKLPRRLKTIPHSILTQDQIEKIMAQVDTTDILGIRNRTILELLWATGIRTGELCRLCLTDVDLEQKTVYIMASPGAQERTIPVTVAAHHWLEIYLEQARPQLLREQQNNALFLGRYGSRLSQVTLATTIHSYFKKAGVDKNGNCRIFRHTLATTMLENGADIRYLQQILGHRSLNSTQIYAKVSIRKLKEVHNQAHPTSRIGHPQVEKQDP